MPEKPVNEAARSEPSSEPAPTPDSSKYRIKCTHAVDGSWAGWLDYSGPGNWMYLTGDPNTPGGMVFEDYYNTGNRYLNPVGTYVGNPRYAGANGNPGDSQAAWNYWVRATPILWDGKQLIQMSQSTPQHLYDYGSGWVYWGTRTDTGLNCQRVPV
jgi:hypothetical protein